MSLRKITLLGSNLASATDLKKIETPHSLCCDFRGYKTFTTSWSDGTVQVWVQDWVPALGLQVIWQSLWRLSQKVIEILEGKINGQARGAALRLCLHGSDWQHKHRVFPSRWQSLLAATGLLEENMLPLSVLHYWLSSRANKVLMLCKFWAATSHFFFHLEWNFPRIG